MKVSRSPVANGLDPAVVRICETLDRMRLDGPRLVESPVVRRDLGSLWPRFALWMIGGKSRKDALIEFTVSAPTIQDQITAVGILMEGAANHTPIDDVAWRRLRGIIGCETHEYVESMRYAPGDNTANAIAERTPEMRYVMMAGESVADMAWTMYADSRFVCDSAALAIRYAAESWGWWKAQAAWHRKQPLPPMTYWSPEIQAGRIGFARRATDALLEIAA